MSDLKLTKEHDLQITNGELVLISSKDEWVAQRVKINLKTYKGEWYLDNTVGVPYFQTLLKKNVSITLVDSIFKNVITSTVGVNKITSYNSSLKDGTYTLNFTFVSDRGTIQSIFETIDL